MTLRARLLTWWLGARLRPVILTLQAGDVLVLEADHRVSPAQIALLKARLPAGVEVLVCDGVKVAAVLRDGARAGQGQRR
jgi:hypothetical protein